MDDTVLLNVASLRKAVLVQAGLASSGLKSGGLASKILSRNDGASKLLATTILEEDGEGELSDASPALVLVPENKERRRLALHHERPDQDNDVATADTQADTSAWSRPVTEKIAECSAHGTRPAAQKITSITKILKKILSSSKEDKMCSVQHRSDSQPSCERPSELNGQPPPRNAASDSSYVPLRSALPTYVPYKAGGSTSDTLVSAHMAAHGSSRSSADGARSHSGDVPSPSPSPRPHLVQLMDGDDVGLALQALQLAAQIHDHVFSPHSRSNPGMRKAMQDAAGPLYDEALTAARAIRHRALRSLVKEAVRRYADPRRGAPDDVLRIILELLTGAGGAAASVGGAAAAAGTAATAATAAPAGRGLSISETFARHGGDLAGSRTRVSISASGVCATVIPGTSAGTAICHNTSSTPRTNARTNASADTGINTNTDGMRPINTSNGGPAGPRSSVNARKATVPQTRRSGSDSCGGSGSGSGLARQTPCARSFLTASSGAVEGAPATVAGGRDTRPRSCEVLSSLAPLALSSAPLEGRCGGASNSGSSGYIGGAGASSSELSSGASGGACADHSTSRGSSWGSMSAESTHSCSRSSSGSSGFLSHCKLIAAALRR